MGQLDRLDGLGRKRSGNDDDKVDSSSSIDSWLRSHLPEDYASRQQTRPGQKRVSCCIPYHIEIKKYTFIFNIQKNRCVGLILKKKERKNECVM